MPVIVGRLFGPELPGAGVAASAEWDRDILHVKHDLGMLDARTVQCEASGFNLDQLRIGFAVQGASYAFIVSHEESKAALLNAAPPEAREALKRATRAPTRVRRRFLAMGLTLGILAILVPIAVYWLILFASHRIAGVVPVEQEEQLGALVLAQTRATREVVEQGVAVDALRTIGAKLTTSSRYRYRWYVVRATELNAFAAPGGVVVVTTGLLKTASSAEEVAGVLAHEIAHAELRHGTTALIKSLGVRGLFGMVLGGMGPDAPELFSHFTELQFSREAEREADREGLRRLREAQIDPEAMLSMFSKLQQHGATRGPEMPAFLSTHPGLEERMSAIGEQLSRAPAAPAQPLQLDYAAVRASL